MEMLPKDPAILVSWLNMKLRDSYTSLENLCDDLNISIAELLDYTASKGVEYDPEHVKFML